MVSIIISLQILSLMIILNHGQDTFDCNGYEDDSFHPIFDADDCRHYWHCIYVDTVYMHAVKRVCPAGTEFDATLKQCETSSLVDCRPPKSPHLPRTTSTTKAWKWIYSRLFSRKHWKATMPSTVMLRRQPISDLEDPPEIEITTMIIPEPEMTQQIRVLPFTLPQPTTSFSIEELSKNLNALVLNSRPRKHKSGGMKFFQIGEPENEAQIYISTTQQRTRRTRLTTQSTSTQITTQSPLTTLFLTTELPTTTIITTTVTDTHPPTTITTITSPMTSTSITTLVTQPDSTINMTLQSRNNRRRQNMTLYILTSDDHKIRQFSVNHTRGLLINCNQLRRRLLGRRRRLRDVIHTTTNHTLIMKHSSTSSIQIFHYKLIVLILFLTKLIINT